MRDMMPKATIEVPNVISANVGSSFLVADRARSMVFLGIHFME
ncbi:MAG TPA: hypothetical protein PLF39_05620 [Synergistales bacterium]|nr:hypothetical protein [Synergistales bacterium]